MPACVKQVSDVTLSNLAMQCPKLSKLVGNCCHYLQTTITKIEILPLLNALKSKFTSKYCKDSYNCLLTAFTHV